MTHGPLFKEWVGRFEKAYDGDISTFDASSITEDDVMIIVDMQR